MQEIIEQAIRDRRRLRLKYDDDVFDRIVEPHVLYRTSRGQVALAGHHIEQATMFGARRRWKIFVLDLVRSATLSAEPFQPDASFDPANKRYSGGIIRHVGGTEKS